MTDIMTQHTDTIHETATDPETLSRRDALVSAAEKSSRRFTLLGIGAIPIALAAAARTASAQTTSDLKEALQFLLLVVQLQAELHLRAASSNGFIASADISAMAAMRIQDGGQAQAIASLITAAGDTPADKPAFDFTAKGAFPGFNFTAGQYSTYQIITQGLEDLGVRAFKGQIIRMGANKNAMTEVATYASIQARHAAEIRRLRGKKAWVTGASRDDLPAFFQPVYTGEDATVHAGFDSAALAGNGGISAVTEAFDEPLTKAQASVVINPFLP